MNAHHEQLVEWAFSFLDRQEGLSCLDLGCGGGATISFLLEKKKAAFCCGVDYSKVAVEEARKKNTAFLKNGRCRIEKADVSSLPFEEESFDIVSAVETLYFWPDPGKALLEANRVMKQGGKMIIANEDDGSDAAKANWLKSLMPEMRFYDAEQLKALLLQAEFKNVESHSKGSWVVAIAEK